MDKTMGENTLDKTMEENILDKTKEQWIDEAIIHYQAANYEKALDACEYAIQLDATFARPFHGKGLVLMQQKKYNEAFEAYNQACRRASHNAKIHSDIGRLFYIQKNYEGARNAYKIAIQFDRRYEQIYENKLQLLVNYSDYLWQKGQHDKAIAVLQQILSFDPHSTLTRSTLELLQSEISESKLGTYSFSKDNTSSYGRLSASALNREWHSDMGIVHPFNCGCTDCADY